MIIITLSEVSRPMLLIVLVKMEERGAPTVVVLCECPLVRIYCGAAGFQITEIQCPRSIVCLICLRQSSVRLVRRVQTGEVGVFDHVGIDLKGLDLVALERTAVIPHRFVKDNALYVIFSAVFIEQINTVGVKCDRVIL